MASSKNKRLLLLICLGLVLGTLLPYGQVLRHEFTNYDDPDYVVWNKQVQGGVTLRAVAWAFTTRYASNWHPLTWISHMVDCQLWGLRPGGHHLTNLLLHLANTLLLFAVLRRMTGATWRSALVAALFAWHPLHVESVAWVAERKDVLSACFWLLTILAYLRYVERPGPKRYLLTLLLFALGLLSKPMVVTLPCVLLLLDYWPLNRHGGTAVDKPPVPWHRLVWEKVPFFILAAVASTVTFRVQASGGSVASLAIWPPSVRIANASVSYLNYLRRMIWPGDLAVFYPMPDSWPAWQVIGAITGLIMITLMVWANRRSHPCLLFGWLWYLGTLVPVIGLVQVGIQSLADRYTYLPLIGIFIMLVWGVADLSQRWPGRRLVLGTGSAFILAGCLILTWFQVRVWRDGLTLFAHALAVTTDNAMAHDCRAAALNQLGRYEEALAEYKAALRVQPGEPVRFYNLGLILARQGKVRSAIEYYEATLRDLPDYNPAHYRLAQLLVAQGRLEEAARHYQEYLRTSPDPADVHYNLGNLRVSENRLPEAVNHYRESLRLAPDSADAHSNLGAVLVRLGNLGEAVDHFKAALRLKPNFPEAEDQLGGVLQKLGHLDGARLHYAEAVRLKPELTHARLKLGLLLAQQAQFEEAKMHLNQVLQREPTNDVAYYNLAGVLAAQGRWEAAADAFTQVVRLKPGDADAHARLAKVLVQGGKAEAARSEYREALRLEPDWAEPLRGLAVILATHPRVELRDGAEAVRLAQRAVVLTQQHDPQMLSALDQAYAEAGRFEAAIQTAQQAQALALTLQQAAVAQQAEQRLTRYRAGKPWRE
ncbi:MAG: Tetratricopeptide 2 repeat protein [Pedosphaera sp.]|nr:Tetratricopeptide 2 repeat protein [Pedosphaera sp.]